MLNRALTTLVCLLAILTAVSMVRGQDKAPEEAWVLAATLEWREPYAIKATPAGTPPESAEEHLARRVTIAAAIWRAVQAEDPLPMGGATPLENRRRGALFVASLMNQESHFHLLAGRYHCRGMHPKACDSGQAWGYGQVHVAEVSKSLLSGWTGEDLDADVGKQAIVMVRVLAAWSRVCTTGKGVERFLGYASGKCVASQKMSDRWDPAEAYWRAHPVP